MKSQLHFFTILLFILLSAGLKAQNKPLLTAIMPTEDAMQFSADYPEEIEILADNNNKSVVTLTYDLAEVMRSEISTHGSGFITQPDLNTALAILNSQTQRESQTEYTITEDSFVNACLDAVNPENIEATILELESYGTRHHTTPEGEQAILDQKAIWDSWIADSGRTDIRTRIYTHTGTPMPSLILTIDGAANPDEYIIVGGHMDSTAWNRYDAPGADDNASGIASLNEMFRVLLEKQFVPKRTVEIMAYAAEEIGLVGSAEIAAEYAQNNINVLGYVQFDMTGYKGSSKDVYVAQDSYNSTELNNYLVDLMNHYNTSGAHAFSYGFTSCGYGCSDHASWAANGFHAAFPFEAAFEDSNPNIHTPDDLYSFFDTPLHAAKFAKLGLEFIIEGAKVETLAVPDFSGTSLITWTKDKKLYFDWKNNSDEIQHLEVYNIHGQRLFSRSILEKVREIDLQNLSSGFYFIRFQTLNNREISKKISLN